MRRAAVVIAVAGAGLAFALATLAADGARRPAVVVAAVRLAPENGSVIRGAAYFRQRGGILSGWVVAWGFGPNTRHAVHFHGPNGRCSGPPADPIAAHADLVADAKGVAFLPFSVQSRSLVLKRGVYYNVHLRGAADGKTPSLACGDVRPERLAPPR